MKTAVDWLFEKLWETPKDKFTWHSILEQAKQMEKEQIIDAIETGWCMGCDKDLKLLDTEKYYNETYGK